MPFGGAKADSIMGLCLKSILVFWHSYFLFSQFLRASFSWFLRLSQNKIKTDNLWKSPAVKHTWLIFSYYCCCFQELCEDLDVSSQAKNQTDNSIFGEKLKLKDKTEAKIFY